MPGVALLCFGFLALGFGLRGAFTGKSTAPLPTTIMAKPTAAPAAPPAPVVEPVAGNSAHAAAVEAKPPVQPEVVKAAPTDVPPSVQAVELEKAPSGSEQVLWKTGKKPAAKPRKPALEAEEESLLKPAAAPKPAPVASATPKPAPAAKPAKKPAKAWVDPFAQ
jgi:hypothetical protein